MLKNIIISADKLVYMATQVQTATAAPVLAPVLHLGLHFYFDRVSAILKRHMARGDRTALTLSNWGIEVCNLILAHKGRSLLLLLAQKIHELRYKHLTARMDHAPLHKAYVAHGRLWDEWMLRHYLKLDPKNGTPFPGEESLALAKEDPFANELIECVEEMLKSGQELAELVKRLPPPDARWLDPVKTQAAPERMALREYQEIADYILEQEEKEGLGAFFETELQDCKQGTAASNKQNLENAAVVRDALTGIERFVTESLNFIEESHARTVASMQELLERSKRGQESLNVDWIRHLPESGTSMRKTKPTQLQIMIAAAAAA
jgi:hypothetical protein